MANLISKAVNDCSDPDVHTDDITIMVAKRGERKKSSSLSSNYELISFPHDSRVDGYTMAWQTETYIHRLTKPEIDLSSKALEPQGTHYYLFLRVECLPAEIAIKWPLRNDIPDINECHPKNCKIR